MTTAVGKIDRQLKGAKATAAADGHGSVIEHRGYIIKTIEVAEVSWTTNAGSRV
jgi:hypothetical protein